MSAPAGIAAVLALAACAPVVSGGAKPGWVERAPQLDRAIEWAVTALTRDGHDAHSGDHHRGRGPARPHADTLDKVDPVALAEASAAMAVLAFVVADLPGRLDAP